MLPSELYWNDDTLTALNEFFAADLLKAYEEGVLVALQFAVFVVCQVRLILLMALSGFMLQCAVSKGIGLIYARPAFDVLGSFCARPVG